MWDNILPCNWSETTDTILTLVLFNTFSEHLLNYWLGNIVWKWVSLNYVLLGGNGVGKWRRGGEEKEERRRSEEEQEEGGLEKQLSHLLKVLSFLNFTPCSIHSDIASLSPLKPAQKNPLPRPSLWKEFSVYLPALFYLIFLYSYLPAQWSCAGVL